MAHTRAHRATERRQARRERRGEEELLPPKKVPDPVIAPHIPIPDVTGGKIPVFTDPRTGRAAGVTLPGGRTFLGLSPEDVQKITEQEQARTARPEGTIEVKEVAKRKKAVGELQAQFEEAGVFKDVKQELIISPEQESIGVILRIIESIRPGFVRRLDKKVVNTVKKGKEPISFAEITMLEDDLKEMIFSETATEIESRIIETENGLIQLSLLPPVKLEPITAQVAILGVVGGAAVGSAVAKPIGEFVGTDGQIRSLELALSQYNEMITLPARSVTAGMSPEMAFEQLNRMEDGILKLEEMLKLSSLTSTKVALALRGRGIEARLLKLKEKLQASRLIVAQRAAQEAFGEVEIPASMAFLRRLQNGRR